jgi:hypothetical protein
MELNSTSLISDANLQAYYRFEGNPNDSTANARNGTDNSSVTYSSGNGKFGQGIGYGGSPQYTDTPYFPWGTNALSVVLWFKISSGSSFCFYGGQGAGGASGFTLDYGLNGGASQLGVSRVGTAGVNNAYASWTTDTNWHHLAVTCHASTGVVVYLDGASFATNSGTANVIDPVRNNFVGCRNLNTGVDAFFVGAIDDLAIFNRALTAAEVSSLLAGGASPPGRIITQAISRSNTY